jgi:thiol-disulfide isomerase/thioredoxin
LIALSSTLAGCSSLRDSKVNPRNWFSKNDGKSAPPSASPPPGALHDSSAVAGQASRAAGSGILAGRVIDSFNQKRPGASIQAAAVDGSPNEPPIEATADGNGYFVIERLEPGRRYRLTARWQQDGQNLTGATLATPPNPVVLIKVSDDLVGLDTPPFKPKGADGSKQSDRNRGAVPGRPEPDGSWSPDAAPKYLHEPDSGPQAPTRPSEVPSRPELQTNVGINMPPRATIPNGPSTPHSPPPGKGGQGGVSEPFARPSAEGMPSCILSGNRLTDFVLSDLNGQPFQLSQHKSRLVLLDFWGTWCAPCIQGMPYLVDLQRRYAPQGLEVIGIAYEEEMPFSQQVEQVNFIRRRQSLNYKILLGAGDSCPVLTKLDVRTFPTLVLLDEDGEIVWRGEGLSPQNKARLELEITRRIGSR